MMRVKAALQRLLLACVLAFILFIPLLYVLQRSLMYFPPAQVHDTSDLKDFVPVNVITGDHLRLTGYFHAPEKVKPVILYFHGNSSQPAWQAYESNALRGQGYGVLLAGYRGYSGNPGTPTEAGLFADAEAYETWLKANYPHHPVVLYGQSLGSGIAVEMAVRHPPAALILEVPFFSALSVAQRRYWFVPFISFLMKDPYRSDLKIRQIGAPKLFLLAQLDRVVTLGSGERLYEAAGNPKTKIVFAGASHTTVYQYGAAARVTEFLKGVFK